MEIRRLLDSDLILHGPWFLPRFTRIYHHMNDRAALTWFRSIAGSNDFLPLASDFGIALGYINRPDVLALKPAVQIGFVWVKDRANAEQTAAAVEFYKKYAEWAASKFLNVVILPENTDIPANIVKDNFERVLTKEVKYLRVGKE